MDLAQHSAEEGWVGRAREAAPLIAALAPRIESERALPPELLENLHAKQLFRMLLPRSLGGGEVEPATLVQVLETLAMADGSTAWCVGQASGCALSAAYLAPEVAREIFGPPDAVLAWGATNRDAKAVPVEGGYRVAGRWHFASGSRHAAWLGGHCTLLGPDGPQGERTMLFPRAAAGIEDVWQVMGLRGTGSDSYSVAEIFVPARYSFARDMPEDRRETGPLYRFTTHHIYGMGFAGVALGLARASLDAFTVLAQEKRAAHGTQLLRDGASVQLALARAEATLQAARSLLLETARALWQEAVATGSLPLPLRARLRLASTHAIGSARAVVESAYSLAGASAIFDANPFERRFRDMHAVSQQIQGQPANLEMVGQYLLGLPPNPRL